jgi:serine phosphatase RsbU (regulator of sigma subunit)
MKAVGQSQPQLHQLFDSLLNQSSAYYAVSDVAIYTRSKETPGWQRMHFLDNDVLLPSTTSNPSLRRLDHRLKRRFHRMQAVLLGEDDMVHLFVNLTGNNDSNHYFLGMELDSETFTGFIASQFRLFLVALIMGLFLSRFLAHIFVRKIARPIEELSQTVSKVAQGDLSHEVQFDRKDEIGQLAMDVNTMVAELREWDRVKRIEFELEKGQEIQREFLPRTIPNLPNWEIAARFQPAGKVSGDFYDVFIIEGGYMGLVIGDVCDKGVGSALYMALFRSLIRVYCAQMAEQQEIPTEGMDRASALSCTRTAECSDPRDCLQAVSLTNDYIARIHGEEGMFATIFFGILDPASGRLNYTNGGHEPLLQLGKQGIKNQLRPTGPAVGMMPDMSFGIQEADLGPGDILLGFTDGLTEARSPADELYTRARLDSLFDPPADTAGALLARIETNVHAFMDMAPRNDDITMLAVQRGLS